MMIGGSGPGGQGGGNQQSHVILYNQNSSYQNFAAPNIAEQS